MQAGKNDIVIFLLVTTVLILLLTGLIITLVYLYQKKQMAFKESLETLKLDHEKNLMAAQLEIQENTFQQISRDIHDNINLSLTLAKLHLNTLAWDEKDRALSQLNSSVELISQSIVDLSNISKSLNSDIISTQGLITALKTEVGRIHDTGLFGIDLRITGDPVYMNMQKDLIIFRIIQEAFNNIIKHAGANQTGLILHYDSAELHITIQDDGKGFLPLPDMTNSKNGKAGLKNMETRTKTIGGKMRVESSPGKGTHIYFTIPY